MANNCNEYFNSIEINMANNIKLTIASINKIIINLNNLYFLFR